jgi:dihydropteroate synthase
MKKTELERVLPTIEKLVGNINVPISIDTIKPAVAKRRVAAGAA